MTTELTPRDYLDLFKRRAWVIVLASLVGVIGALVYSAVQTPLYSASARILINQNTANDIFDPVTGVTTSERATTNEVQLLLSQLVSNAAEAKLGFGPDYKPRISARAEARADIVIVSAIDSDADRARNVAQTFATSYVDVRRNEFVLERIETAQKLSDRIEQIDADIAALGPDADTSRKQALRDDLADSNDRLEITAALGNNGSARIIDNAELPENPISPRPNRNLFLGGVLGLMAGAGGALLLESLDRSIKSREVIEGLTPGLPSLASIPRIKSEHNVIALEKPESVESDLYRSLRAGIEFASLDRNLQVIQVTSPGPSAGKTTVAANLAVVMAQAGHKVGVVDADLRRPQLHQLFELPQVPGISSVIIGHESGDDAAHSMTLDNGRLWVFPSGPIPPGPADLLGSERSIKTFKALRNQLDVIILDSPPVLPVSDALILSRLADATIVVANTKSTKRDDLQRALEQLEQADANVIGTVLNQVKNGRSSGMGYGYGYGYGQGSDANGSGRSLLDRLFGRNKNLAPRLEGTLVIASEELPRFKAARSFDGENAPTEPARPARAAASSKGATSDAAKSASAKSAQRPKKPAANKEDQLETSGWLDSDSAIAAGRPAKKNTKRKKNRSPKTASKAETLKDAPAEWGDDIGLM